MTGLQEGGSHHLLQGREARLVERPAGAVHGQVLLGGDLLLDVQPQVAPLVLEVVDGALGVAQEVDAALDLGPELLPAHGVSPQGFRPIQGAEMPDHIPDQRLGLVIGEVGLPLPARCWHRLRGCGRGGRGTIEPRSPLLSVSSWGKHGAAGARGSRGGGSRSNGPRGIHGRGGLGRGGSKEPLRHTTRQGGTSSPRPGTWEGRKGKGSGGWWQSIAPQGPCDRQGYGGRPQPSPTRGIRGPQPATGGTGRITDTVTRAAVPLQAPRGHGERCGAAHRATGRASGPWGGVSASPRAMRSSSGPWGAARVAHSVPHTRLCRSPRAVAGATATTSAPQPLLLGHRESFGHAQHPGSMARTLAMAAAVAKASRLHGHSKDLGRGAGVGPRRRLWPR